MLPRFKDVSRPMKPLLLLLLLGALVVIPFQLVRRAQAEDAAKIVNMSTYVDSSKRVHILGEVLNMGEVILSAIFVNGSLYNATNHIVESQKVPLMCRILEPGQKGPFELVMSKSDGLVLSVRYETTPNRLEERLELFQAYRTKFLLLRIVGWVKNNGNRSADQVRVIGTFYDEDGRVVHAQYLYSTPGLIPVGSGAYFEITIAGLRAQSIRSYTLFAESNEYRSAIGFFTTA